MLVFQLSMCMGCGTVFSDNRQGYCMEKKCYDSIIRDVEFRLDGIEDLLTGLYSYNQLTVIEGELRSQFYDDESMLNEVKALRRTPGSLTPRPVGEPAYHLVVD